MVKSLLKELLKNQDYHKVKELHWLQLKINQIKLEKKSIYYLSFAKKQKHLKPTLYWDGRPFISSVISECFNQALLNSFPLSFAD